MCIKIDVYPITSHATELGPEVPTCGANKKGALILGRASIVWLVTVIIPASNSTHLETGNQP